MYGARAFAVDDEEDKEAQTPSPPSDKPEGEGEDKARHVSHANDRRFRSRNEFARIRDVRRQLQAWQSTHDPVDVESAEARPCPDTALAAFAQLAALRMDCRCAIISLIDDEHEHVLAEVTKSTPLQRSAGEQLSEPLCIGTSKFPRSDGLAAQSIEVWRTARRVRDPVDAEHYYLDGLTPHSFVVSDARRNPDVLSSSLMKQLPWLRFFCAVPLRSAQGSVIGQLAILCPRPRYGVSCAEMILLEDLADTVVEHLNATVVKTQQKLSDRYLQALTLFNSGKNSLREWWMNQEDIRVLSTGRHVAKGNVADRNQRADTEFGLPSSGLISAPELIQSPSAGESDSSGRGPAFAFLPKVTQDIKEGDMYAHLFARASNLLREAVDATGVVILNAKHLATPDRHDVASKTDHDSMSSAESGVDRATLCEIGGISFRSDADAQHTPFALPKSVLKRLVKQYPNGHVVHTNADGAVAISSSEDDKSSDPSGREEQLPADAKRQVLQALLKAVQNVRTLAFLPLWDQAGERWHSCVVVWSTSNQRFFQNEAELLYLAAFGQSISSELSRIRSYASNIAKDTFISSISHELRSPLHGILAGAELLEESNIDKHQQELLRAIDTSGKLLLDTIEHILDYSKISSHARASSTSTIHPMQSVKATDLAQLTEDVVESCFAARRSQASSSKGEVTATLDIQHSLDWMVMVAPGAWVRIVTNLVGNAIKYTNSGHIAVRLSGTAADRLTVQLEIDDSGAGMSRDFLSHSAFTPFRQENALSEGTGLGLSITKKLIEDLDGKLWIKSKVDMGTKVRVRLALNLADQKSAVSATTCEVDQLQLITNTSNVDKVTSSILTATADWLPCQVSSASEFVPSSVKSEVAMTDSMLASLRQNDEKGVLSAIAGRQSHLIVFTGLAQPSLQADDPSIPIKLIPVTQPVGPRKLLRALAGRAQLGTAAVSGQPVDARKTMEKFESLTASIRPKPMTQQREVQEKRTVLLVEDNSINMKILVTFMRKLNIAHACAVNGQEALDAYMESASSFALILMDISMPIMDGLTATKAIRKFESKQKLNPVHITVLTGVTSQESKDRAFACGVDDFYSKPVQMKELQKLLDRLSKESGVTFGS